MGAAEQQQFTQYPYKYGDGLRGSALAQTRDGKDELITPVALWELDATSGLYLPPGLSANPRKPRVEATLTGSITPTHTTFNATTTSAQAVAANPNRKYLLIINWSDTDIYLKIGATAVVNEGIALRGKGSSYEMSAASGNLMTGAVNVIHGGSGNKLLLITEGV